MELTSSLYETEIMHHRLTPKEHKFSYRFFSFYINLDEIDELTSRITLLSHNKFNIYSFFDKDHMEVGDKTIKEKILNYLAEQGIDLTNGRIMLLTYLRTFGYVFNPVSFYYCFDENDSPVCVVPEIGNTFGEIKAFFINQNHLVGNKFKDCQDKYYYISPFTRLNDQLDFKLTIPSEYLDVRINTSRDGENILLTSMMGPKKELNNVQLFWMTLKFPFVTLKVIVLIHWHALLLWFKKIVFKNKEEHMDLQRDVLRKNIHLKPQ